jgi:cytochrome oxidase Cu insertion factor (SCO1/SenC/PrrC family)
MPTQVEQSTDQVTPPGDHGVADYPARPRDPQRVHLRAILIAMWVVAALAVAGVGAAVLLTRHNNPDAVRFTPAEPADAPLPVLFDAAAFKLTDQDGRPFDSRQLAGRVWVADFIFTHCVTFCPVMTQSMREFQQQSAAAGLGGVRMVSFTVDPDRDTPPVLKQYAAANGADPSRWTFLTGDQRSMWQTCRDMKLSVGPGDALGGAAGMQVMHSSRFLLIDGAGHVRGIYDFKEGGYLKQLLHDAKQLAAG